MKILRILISVVFILFGLLIFISAFTDSGPTVINFGSHQAYRVVAHPPPHPFLLGSIAVIVGIILFKLPFLINKKGQ